MSVTVASNSAVNLCRVVWCGVVWCGVVQGGVVWCGVVCTEHAPRWRQSPVAPVMQQTSSAVRTPLRWTFKTPRKATVTY